MKGTAAEVYAEGGEKGGEEGMPKFCTEEAILARPIFGYQQHYLSHHLKRKLERKQAIRIARKTRAGGKCFTGAVWRAHGRSAVSYLIKRKEKWGMRKKIPSRRDREPIFWC